VILAHEKNFRGCMAGSRGRSWRGVDSIGAVVSRDSRKLSTRFGGYPFGSLSARNEAGASKRCATRFRALRPRK